MSFLVKGIAIPNNCYQCDFRVRNCECMLIEGKCVHGIRDLIGRILPKDRRRVDCPLVEIPTPHGRLIDADELLKNHAIIADKELINLLYRGTLRKMIDKAPTVIEAENSSAIDDDVKKYCDYLKSETYDFCNRIENGEVSE